jgi:hypothetical protein
MRIAEPPTIERSTDLHRGRLTTAIAMVVAPIAILVVRGLIPYQPRFSAQEAIAAATESPGSIGPIQAASIVATVAWLFAVIGLYRLLVHRTPVLAVGGGVLALVGWSMIPLLVTIDVLIFTLADLGGSGGADLLAKVQGAPGIVAMTALFMGGHVLGMILLGVGLIRSRRTHAAVGALVIVGSVGHVIAAMGFGSNALDVLAYAILTVGMIGAARAVLTPDDDSRTALD